MKVLVTGAAGFVGTALSARLAQQGHDVTALVRRPEPSLERDRVTCAVGDINDISSFEHVLIGQDAVVHLAARAHITGADKAKDPLAEFRRTNRDATVGLADRAAAVGVGHFIFVSSIGVNGDTGAFSERDQPNPRRPYAISKMEAEQALGMLSAQSGLPVTIVRPPLIYGAGAPGNMRRLLWLVRNAPALPLGLATAEKSFLGLDNFTDFIASCLHKVPSGRRLFLVSDDQSIQVRDMVASMARGMKRNVFLLPVPTALVNLAARIPPAAGMVTQLFYPLTVDNSHSKRTMNWRPPVGVDDGIARMAEAYALKPW